MSRVVRSKSLSDTPIIKAYPSDQPADAEYQPMHPNLQNAFDASGPKAPVNKGITNNRRNTVAGPGSWKENKAVEKSLAELRMGRRNPAGLCWALKRGDEKEAHRLVGSLSSDYIDPDTGKNGLQTAAWIGCSSRLFERIISFTNDVNARDPNNGYTALMCAISKNRPRFVRALIQNGRVNPNIQNNQRNTALHMAVRGGQAVHLEIVNMLLEMPNIDTEVRGFNNLTPLEAARNMEHEEHIRKLNANPMSTLKVLYYDDDGQPVYGDDPDHLDWHPALRPIRRAIEQYRRQHHIHDHAATNQGHNDGGSNSGGWFGGLFGGSGARRQK